MSDYPLGFSVIVFFGFCRLISASRCRVFQLSANNTSTRRCLIGQCCPFFPSPFFSLSASVHSLYSFPHRFLISSYLFVRSFIHLLPQLFFRSYCRNCISLFHYFKRQCDICCKVVADNSIFIALASVWCSFGSLMLCVFLYFLSQQLTA